MSWYDSIFNTVGNWFSDDSKVGKSLISGGLGLYSAYNQNKAIDSYVDALNSASSASSDSYNDYVNYLNTLAQWQAVNGDDDSVNRPYIGQLQSAINQLEPYYNLSLDATKNQVKAYKDAIKELQNMDTSYSVDTPAYAKETGISDYIKKKKEA